MSTRLICGDARDVLPGIPAELANTCITSPPYWKLRDYGHPKQLGLEKTPEQYVANMVRVFQQVRRILREDGTLWLNLGDSYATGGAGGHQSSYSGNLPTSFHGHNPRHGEGIPKRSAPPGLKVKDLCGIPWRVALALQADGWYLRSDIIWHKPSPMPESVKDRPTKAHEYIFLLSKSQRYYYDADAIREPVIPDRRDKHWDTARTGKGFSDHKHDADRGRLQTPTDGWVRMSNPKGRNKRTVWTVPSKPNNGAHFSTFPPDLIRPCVLAGCPEGGTILDPFAGIGTTGEVAESEGRNSILIELVAEHASTAKKRTRQNGLFARTGK